MWVERMAVRGGGGHYSVTFIFSEQCLESKNAAKRSWKLIHFHHGKSWKSHGILFLNLCGNPVILISKLHAYGMSTSSLTLIASYIFSGNNGLSCAPVLVTRQP